MPDGGREIDFLRAQTMKGAADRYKPITERVSRQLEKELALIGKLKLAGYFLIVWDIVRFCRENGILVQGRGSAANSAVCYRWGSPPSIRWEWNCCLSDSFQKNAANGRTSISTCPAAISARSAIQYVYKRYGELGAAMTANVITYRGRSAAREVGKVLGFDEETLNKLSGLVGGWEWQDPEDTTDRQFTNAGLDLQDLAFEISSTLCVRVQDLPRHLGQHSGGMVMCQGQLDSVVPLEPATMPGRVVVQWDKEDCADLGIIKVDLLGLGMMAVLKDSIGLIQEHYWEKVDLAHLPQDGPESLRRDPEGGHDRHVPDRKPGADVVFAAATVPKNFMTS